MTAVVLDSSQGKGLKMTKNTNQSRHVTASFMDAVGLENVKTECFNTYS